MTQEEKDILIKDLSARLPYGVKFMIDEKYLTGDMIKSGYDKIQELYGITCEGNVELLNMDYHMPVESIKPYLFPMSSMTEEHKKEYNYWKNEVPVCYYEYGDAVEKIELLDSPESFEYLIENHFDYRGLIERGLAIDATGLNIY